MTTITFVEHSSEDADGTFLSFSRSVGGANFTFSDGSPAYAGIYFDIQQDDISGLTGIYALSGRAQSSGVDFTIKVQAGYTFDLTGFQGASDVGTVTVFYNGMTLSQTYNVTSGIPFSFAGLTTFNDVTSVTFTADDYALFQNLEITDVKPIAPTVTDARISISGASGTGGAYKIGDTVTATWNNTVGGDNNSGITGVTVDFSQFGGAAAVAATNSGGTWTATYTIVSGAIDATNRNVSVTATNAGGPNTTTDSTNATVDNIAPTVTDARIAISGASGTGGTYKIGDTVTATWNNTAGGDNNSDTIAGVAVNFSQFGGGSAVAATNSGGTWSATYTIVAGSLDGIDNRNVAFTVTDNAGNARTTADTSNARIDNVKPGTIGGLALSADTGSSAVDFITKTAAQTISATLAAPLASGDTVYGSLDNGASWSDLTSRVSGTTLTWSGATLSGSNTLRLQIVDAAGNAGIPAVQAYVLDTTAPAAPGRPSMTGASDTGFSNADAVTRNTTPTFTGTAESGSTVTLYDTNGTTILGSATATGGTWSIASSILAEGSHTLTALATDTAGNRSAASAGLAVTIDTAAPTGFALSATTVASANATSGAAIGTLSAADSQAVAYTLVAGNGTNDADNGRFTISGGTLAVGGAGLSAGTYHLYLAATDAAGNVANQAFVLTVADAPTVSSIVRSGGASSGVAAATGSVGYTVTFNEAVSGVDAGDFTLTTTGTANGHVASVSGSGTTYTVTVDSLGGDGTLRLDLNGSGTGIANGNQVAIAGGYTAGASYTLDHTPPAAPSMPDMAAASDTGASNVDNITRNATPTFTGTAESGSTVTLYDTDGTTVLGSTTAIGGTWSIMSSVLAGGGHTVTAKAVDAAGNVSTASGGLAIAIDTGAPTVTAVAAPPPGSYGAGQSLDVVVHASEAVMVNTAGGTPHLALTLGTATVYASYVSGSGTTALTFSYVVQAGDNDADGITIGALSANGGTLADAAGNALATTLNGVGSAAAVLVDTQAPVVVSVSVPANGTYYSGEALEFSVNFSEAVTVDGGGGTPRIALILDGSATVYADYVSGSGASTLVFRHLVAPGEVDANGIMVGGLSLHGGTLRDAAGNNAVPSLNSVGSTASVLVDGTGPQAGNVTSAAANGSYKAGSTIAIAIDFGAAVDVDTSGGTPTLALNSGGNAVYSGGSGTSTLTFAYTVASGENSADLDVASSAALALNGATIKGSAGGHADAALALATPGAAGSLGTAKAIVIDTTPPSTTLSGVTLSADTGASATDFTTNVAAQTVGVTLSAALQAGERLYSSVDGGQWIDITGMASGTTVTWTGVTLGTATPGLRFKVSDAAGNDGAVLSRSYVLDTAAPHLQSATVAGATLVLHYDEALDAAHVPAAGAFAVAAGGNPVGVSGVAIDGAARTVTLTLASAIAGGQAVTISHTAAIRDVAGNAAASLSGAAVSNLAPAPVPPGAGTATATIDGVAVQTSARVDADGTTILTTTIPVVQATRQEQVGNNTVADIPLVKTAGGTVLLAAQVPTGAGLQASGAQAPATERAFAKLLAEIQAHSDEAPSGQGALAAAGAGFLQDLGTATPLLVHTIVPVTAGALPAQPLTLVGQGQGQDAGAARTALVIDGSALPAGFAVALENVEFAAVAGALTVTAGAGSRVVAGDGADQLIATGSGTYTVDGGGGTDTLRLAGGTIHDYALRIVDGKTVFTHLGGAGGSVAAANVELLQFAAGGADMTAAGTIGRLYQTVLGRQADQAGLDYWNDHHVAADQALASVAGSLLGSAEGRALAGLDNARFVDLIYRNALDRAPTDAERAGALAQLETHAVGRADLALQLADSDAMLARAGAQQAALDFNHSDVATLVRVYSSLFERAPDEAGINYWLDVRATGLSISAIADRFVAASETGSLHGKLDDGAFVDMLYRTALGRMESAAEKSYWTDQLAAGTLDRGQVLLAFADSAEKIGLVGVIGTSIETLP
ncbi:Ig-like domain-containing protein [Massilia sp. TN1-12]|uniref:Ig-like domain-containing protein n=1 Tax=Massilia paldalensis TaxID=3377675 RepID=UPI003851166F